MKFIWARDDFGKALADTALIPRQTATSTKPTNDLLPCSSYIRGSKSALCIASSAAFSSLSLLGSLKFDRSGAVARARKMARNREVA